METKHSKQIEIMSPVGSYESLMAAIQAKADAVYFGIGKLNMRSRSSQNFSIEDLAKITTICNEHKVKTYLTLNTIIYDAEMKEMQETVDAAKENGVSAIIASDLSVIQYAFSQGVEVHISTQSNISNVGEVRFFSQFADVMVTARELELKQVKHIIDTIEKEHICGPSGNLVQIEIFAHGALCMAVSGKCYLSLDNENSSANRGACLQICRRPYQVKDKDGKIELAIENEYIMSPKDLCTIDFLDRILSTGVSVLKIEGRGRSAEYVQTVSRVYRQASDSFLANEYTSDKIDEWKKELDSVYNRGFWEGYYLGKKMGEWTEIYGNRATKRKEYIGKISNYYSKIKVAELKLESQALRVGDEISISGPTSGVIKSTIKEIRLALKSIELAEKGSVCSIPINDIVRRGDKVYRFVDTALWDV